jgi:hypothetical protein
MIKQGSVELIRKHNSDFKYDLTVGKQGEKIIGELLVGDNVEVKSEIDKWMKSGNHLCEYKSRGKVVDYIKRNQSIGLINLYKGKQFCFAISLETDRLKKIVEKNKYRSVPGGDSNTSWGWLVPLKDLLDVENYG